MIDFKLSAFSDEYADSFEEQLRGMRHFEIEYIELRHLDKKNISTLTSAEVSEAKRKMDAYGIKASAIGSPLGKIKLDGDMNAHLDTARKVFLASNIMETPYVRMFSFYAPDGKSIENMRKEVLEALDRMLLVAKEYGVTLCHENEAAIYGDTPEHCLDLLEHFGGRLKCVFDMGNFTLEGAEPTKAYGLLKDHVAYFHIKDALAAGAVVPPGMGEAKIKEILGAHCKQTFITLEPHLQTFSGLNALVGHSFDNPYKYPDAKTAFTDAVNKLKELIK